LHAPQLIEKSSLLTELAKSAQRTLMLVHINMNASQTNAKPENTLIPMEHARFAISTLIQLLMDLTAPPIFATWRETLSTPLVTVKLAKTGTSQDQRITTANRKFAMTYQDPF